MLPSDVTGARLHGISEALFFSVNENFILCLCLDRSKKPGVWGIIRKSIIRWRRRSRNICRTSSIPASFGCTTGKTMAALGMHGGVKQTSPISKKKTFRTRPASQQNTGAEVVRGVACCILSIFWDPGRTWLAGALQWRTMEMES
jgi:hypothetical protein